MQWFAFVLLIGCSACFAQQSASTGNKTANDNKIPISNKVPPATDVPVTETNKTKKPENSDDPIINGSTVSDVPIIEINSTSPLPPNSSTTITPKTTTEPPKTTTATATPPTINSTAAPVSTTAVPHHDRKFDGPSFVGGIILALGLVAIGFVAFKFYKARTEMNYHTL